MSKRKPATSSKHAHSTKIAAQKANQAIIKSPKDSPPRSVAAGSTESPPESHNDSKREAPLVEKLEAPLVEKLAAPLVEKPGTALQDDGKQTMPDNDSKTESVFSSPTANVRAYQAKLLEMAQANMQLPFEFAQRLATIRSPVEILSVIAEFTSKRIAMFQKFSIEMAELGTKR
jgi:hypothetical protein